MGKRKFFFFAIMVLAIFIVKPVMAEPLDEELYQSALVALGEIEKNCHCYSISDELTIGESLGKTLKEIERQISLKKLSKKELSQTLVIKTKIEKLLSGECFQTKGVLEEVREIIFR